MIEFGGGVQDKIGTLGERTIGLIGDRDDGRTTCAALVDELNDLCALAAALEQDNGRAVRHFGDVKQFRSVHQQRRPAVGK